MSLDTAIVNIENDSNETLYFYRQFVNCLECPLLQHAVLHPEKNTTIDIKTFFNQLYSITSLNTSYLTIGLGENICNNNTNKPSFFSFNDQGEYLLRITQSNECQWSTIKDGRNNLIDFSYITFFYLCIIIILYLNYRYIIFQKLNLEEGQEEQHSTNVDAERYASQLSGYNATGRFGSIDAFRGVVILLMIFVNYGAGKYKLLQHAPWDGLHLADVVFPFFIFIMGVSIVISFRNLAQQTSYHLGRIYSKIFIRSFKLFLLGLIVNSIGSGIIDLNTLRIPGVLQRFSLSYAIAAGLHVFSLNLQTRCLNLPKLLRKLTLYCPQWLHLIVSIVLFIIYYYLTFWWKYNKNCPVGYIGPGGLHDNMSYIPCIGGAAHRIDEIVFTSKHIYQKNFASLLYDPDHKFGLQQEPEGLLGTCNSIILTLIGVHVGYILVSNPFNTRRMIKWSIFSITLGVLTAISVFVLRIPINKNLWSFSFVMLNGSMATFLFAIFYYLIDWKKYWLLGWPFYYAGQNSILLYIGHEVAHDMLPFSFVANSSSHVYYLLSNLVGATVWLWISSWLAKNEILLKV